MSIVSLVARRFLTGKKSNGFLSFIALVSLFGVSLGVAALTVVMGVMEGFETQLRSIITGTHSHVVLYSTRLNISDPPELMERIRAAAPEQIEAISPYIFSEVMLARNNRVMGSMLEGIGPDMKGTTELERHLSTGEMPKVADSGASEPTPGTIVLGSALAEQLGAKLGDDVTVISPFFEKESLQPRSRRFRLGGILSTGMYEYDSKYSMVHIDEARDFFHVGARTASAMKIKTKDPNTSKQLATSWVIRSGPAIGQSLTAISSTP